MWVARDKNGMLWLYISKPKRYKISWQVDTSGFLTENDCLELDSSLFPNVKWEDKEPTEVELQLKIKIEDLQ